MSDSRTPGIELPFRPGIKLRKMLTRVSVKAFCEDQGTIALAATAALDRRLEHVRVTAQLGGLNAACASCVNGRVSDIIAVETRMDTPAMLAGLDGLAEVCDAATRVIVIGRVNDVALYRELMRRGVSDYLVTPFSAAQLAECIAAVSCSETAPPLGRVVAFLGAKGGSGSSAICHNVAWTLSDGLESETIAADLDLVFGTLGIDFNQESPRGVGEALTAGEALNAATMAKLLTKCSTKLSLLTAPCTLDRDMGTVADAAARAVAFMAEQASFVMLDLPRVWTAWTYNLLAQADDVVITTEPDLASLRNVKNLIVSLKAVREAARSPLLVMNKVSVPRRPEIPPRDFANALDQRLAAVLDFDAQLFGMAANNGQMAVEVSPRGKAAAAFRKLAGIIAGKAVPSPRTEGIFAPIIGGLKRKRAG